MKYYIIFNKLFYISIKLDNYNGNYFFFEYSNSENVNYNFYVL